MPGVHGILFLLSHLIFTILQGQYYLMSLRTVLCCFPVAGKQNCTSLRRHYDLIENTDVVTTETWVHLPTFLLPSAVTMINFFQTLFDSICSHIKWANDNNLVGYLQNQNEIYLHKRNIRR